MKSFNEVYEKVYKESSEELEDLRKRKVKTKIIWIIIAIEFTVMGILMGQISNYYRWNETAFICIYIYFTIIILLLCGLIGYLIYFVKPNNKDDNYIQRFKQAVIEPFIKNIDESLNYYPYGDFPFYIYRSGEFEPYDDYYSEDVIEGLLDGKYAVKMAEVHTVSEYTDDEGHTTRKTLFHGVFGNVECSKNINTKLKIRLDKGILRKNLFTNKDKDKIQMDSAEFEKYFDITADNKIIAMQILTADVMEMMIEFIEHSEIGYELTINGDQIYIRFHTGAVFEPKTFKNSLDYSTLKRYYDIIDFIFKVSREINKVIENTDI